MGGMSGGDSSASGPGIASFILKTCNVGCNLECLGKSSLKVRGGSFVL